MAYKSQIIADLGDEELLIPRLVDEALLANDKVKYFFSLLQMAKEHANGRDNDIGYSNMRDERLVYGIDNDIFDKVIQASAKIDSNHYHIPEFRSVLDHILRCIEQMISPLDKMGAKGQLQENEKNIHKENDMLITTTSIQDEYPHNYTARLEALKRQISLVENDVISSKQIEIITSGQRQVGDSLHLLVMDLHKELNILQSKISQESIGGASVYGLTENDRKSVLAFMRGVNETAKLKFEHTGLGTTATRSGEDLIIQNDIGTTDAHVMVLHIKKLKAILTYTDIHIQRLLFFHSLLEKCGVIWNDTESKKSTSKEADAADIYQLSIGTYEAADEKDLYDYLSFLGSRIVFLIDWNRARKSLRNFIKNTDCLRILKWAADNSYGHRAFLKLGGQQLLYEAIRQIDDPPIHYGQELSEVLGRERTIEFLQFVIKTCYENLIEGKSESLIRDRIRAELTNYFNTLQQDVVQIAADHASLLVEIAEAVRNAILNSKYRQDGDFVNRNSKRARIWESKADVLVKEVRTLTKRPNNIPRVFELIIVRADDAGDFLEEAVFLMTLLQKENSNNNNTDNTDFESLSDLLNELAEKAYHDCMEYLKALENAKVVHRGSPHEDVQDFLEAVDMTIAIEHDVDEVYRRVEEALVTKVKDFREFHIFSETARNIERATDSIMKAAMLLRDYALGSLSV